MRRIVNSFRRPLVLLAGICAPLAADEVRLNDGRVLVGKTSIRADQVTVATLDGQVVVARAAVIRIRTDAELRLELDHLATLVGSSSRHGSLELAHTARRFGLHPEMWLYIDRCLASRSQLTTTRFEHRLRRLLGDLEPEVLPLRHRNATVPIKVHELLYRVRPGQPPARRAAIEAILAGLDGAVATLRQRARSASSALQRITALTALAARGDLPFVWRSTVLDRAAQVRVAATDLAAQTKTPESVVVYLAPGLAHRNPAIRIRTAETYARLGDLSAVDILVAAGPLLTTGALAGGAIRGHIAILNQQAYIRDFDVEVAQAAFIADPKIDVLQSGMVLDTAVHAVTAVRTKVVRAYRRALRKLTSLDPGPRTAAWESWRCKLKLPGAKSKRGAAALSSTPRPTLAPTPNASPRGAGVPVTGSLSGDQPVPIDSPRPTPKIHRPLPPPSTCPPATPPTGRPAIHGPLPAVGGRGRR